MSHAVAEGVLAVMLVNAFLGVVAAAEKPKRFMPFLCRDAVVRESAEKVPLAGKGTPAPTIVLGRATVAGPRESFEAGQVQKAGEVLAKYLEKIAGVQCAVVSAELASRRAGPQIFLGDPQGRAAQAFPELSRADAHGFVIAARGGHLHIVGGSGRGTLYGVWFFLQNYASMRIHALGQFGGVITRVALPAPRARYRLSFWCRAQGGAVARYGLMFYLLRHLPWFELGASASKDWTKVELEFPLSRDLLPDEKADISLWLGIGSGASAESQVWFDDVRLEQLSPSGQGNGP